MADYVTTARLRADVSDYKRAMEQAEAATRRIGEQAKKTTQGMLDQQRAQALAGKSAQDSAAAMAKGFAKQERAERQLANMQIAAAREDKQRQAERVAAYERVGTAATFSGAAVVAGLGVAAKAAIDWESAWAGVTKTVNGSDTQMVALEQGLRGLARTLPASQEEIAGVAEAAGQLGVKRADILGFTKTMIGLGVSTNLTADQAATAIAQISNVMGTMDREGAGGVERFASTLVALGNAGASTESDIVAMATRLSGASKVIGASESDVLALANAMSSVGIEAQLGGGVMSRVMLQINSAVKQGGDGLDAFAKVSGVSAQEFANRWAKDPVSAIDSFLQGLNQINATGGDAAGVLTDLGLSGTENASVLLRMAGAGNLLNDSLKLGAQAWEQNTALQAEASKRYETTASKLQIAKNNARDAAINFGSVLTPAISQASDAVSSFSSMMADLPEPVRNALVGVTGFGGAALLAVGGTIKLATGAKNLHDNFTTLGVSAPRTARGIGIVTKAVAAATAAFAVAGSLDQVFNQDKNGIGVESLTKDLLGGADAVDVFSGRIQKYADQSSSWYNYNGVRSYGDALKATFDPSVGQRIDNVFGSLMGAFGGKNPADMAIATDRLRELDGVLTGLVSQGRSDEAQKLFSQFAGGAQDAGVSVDQLKAKLPGYTEALDASANAAQLAGQGAKDASAGTGQLGSDLDLTGSKAQDAADRLDELVKSLADLGSAFGNERASASSYEAALDDAADAAKKYGKAQLDAQGNIKLGSEAGRALESALRGIASSTTTWASNMVSAGASQEDVTARVKSGRDAFIKQAEAMNIPADKAKVLADRYGLIPEDVTTLFEAKNADEATTKAQAFKDTVTTTPDTVGVGVLAPGAVEAHQQIEDLKTSIFTVPAAVGVGVTAPGATQATSETEGLKQSLFTVPKQTEANVAAPGTTGAIFQVGSLYTNLLRLPASTTPHVGVQGAAEAAAEVYGLRQQIAQLQGKTVGIRYVVTGRLPNGGRNLGGGITANDGNADGNILAFANGGRYMPNIGTQQPQIQANRGPQGILWAETGAGPWEAFISGHPAKAERSRGIADDVVGRLGGQVIWPKRFADGGVMGGGAGKVDYAAILDILRGVTGWQDVVDARGNRTKAATAVTSASNALRALQNQQRQAARDLAAAQRTLRAADTSRERAAARDRINSILDKQRLLLGKVAAAEGKLTAARKASADAARATSSTEAKYRADRAPLIDRTIKATASTSKVTKSFLDNIDKLNRMGFRTLAAQLLDMDGDEAQTLAAQAVASASKARSLQAQFATSAALSARADTLRGMLSQPVTVGGGQFGGPSFGIPAGATTIDVKNYFNGITDADRAAALMQAKLGWTLGVPR